MSKPVTLNYQATVPMEERTQLSVDDKAVLDRLPPFLDYVPSKIKSTRLATTPKKKDTMSNDVAVLGSDFVPSEVVKEIKDKRRAAVKELAKKIYEADRPHREKWEGAKRMADKLTPAELKNPTPEQKRVVDISRGRPPLTPQMCAQKALEQLNEEFKLDDIDKIYHSKARKQ